MTADVFRDPVVELYVNSDWEDVTSHVQYKQGVVIERGRGGEDDTTPPQTCRLTLSDPDGRYNPRAAAGPYYGSIGLNTPLRVALRLASDACGSTVSSGWGSTDTVDGQDVYAWTVSGTASNYAKAAGKATHALSAAGDVRISYLADVDLRDVDFACTVTVPTSNVTGGGIAAANLLVHGQGAATSYYQLRLVIQTDETVTVDFWDTGSSMGTTDGPWTVPGLTHSSGQALRVRFQVEGWTMRAKVWPASGSEPFGWHAEFNDEDFFANHPELLGQTGWVGVQSSLLTGNTNGPLTLSYDDFELRAPRFFGEVSAWPRRYDDSGNLVLVPLTAAGIKRRLAQGASPLESAPRRFYSGDSAGAAHVTHYWPLEDGPEVIDSLPRIGKAGGFYNAYAVPDDASPSAYFGQGDLAPWLNKVVGLFGATATDGHVIAADISLSLFTAANGWMVDWARRGSANQGISAMGVFGNVLLGFPDFTVMYDSTAGTLSVDTWASGATTVSTRVPFDGAVHHYRLKAHQSGANVVWSLELDGESIASSSFAATLFQLDSWTYSDGTSEHADALSLGHVAVHDLDFSTSAFEGDDAVFGFRGETAGARIVRLCDEESVPLGWIGKIVIYSGEADTPAMGPQRVATLIDLLTEAERTDRGILYEPRGGPGMQYRTRRSLYSQDPAVTLSFADGEIGTPWAPVPMDDRHVSNDVIARQAFGGEYRHEVTTGRLSVSDPQDGGVGRYDDTVQVSVEDAGQLPGVAEWRAHLGTVDEDRYPAIPVDLHGHGLRGDAAQQFALLDLDIGYRVVLTDVPDVADDVSQLVIGYVETLTPFEHRLELVGVPETPYRVAVLDDADYSRLDSASSTLTTGISSSAASFQVTTTTAGDLWTTDSSQFPLDIVIGGEQMTVSGIAGASSPQTFSVSARSVNGVVKGHSAGAAVHVASPVYIGL